MTDIRYTEPVRVSGGLIRGELTAKKVAVYKGIPYAAPPVGKLRFHHPEPPIPWEGVKDCVAFGISPVQSPLDHTFDRLWTKEFIISSTDNGEDCLTANIWAPAETDADSKYPVVLYFFGGGFISGGSSCEIYDGTEFADRGVIYITFNHRVGNLSLPANEELSRRMPSGCSGNCNLKDAIGMLKWIKKNISAFGGDPDNVTIWGQSAGAAEVSALTNSKAAKGLFNKAVCMGMNSFVRFSRPWLGREDAYRATDELLAGCGKTLDEFLEADETFFAADPKLNKLIVDGEIIQSFFHEGVVRGDSNDIKVIMGAVPGDRLLGGLFYKAKPDCKEAMLPAMSDFFKDDLEKAKEIYDFDNRDFAELLNQINEDNLIISQIYYAMERKKAGADDTYTYYFDHVMPGPDAAVFGSFHSAEVPYFNDYFTPLRGDYWQEEDYRFGGYLIDALTEFIRDGIFSGEEWTTGDYSYTRLNPKGCRKETVDKARYELWTRAYERQDRDY